MKTFLRKHGDDVLIVGGGMATVAGTFVWLGLAGALILGGVELIVLGVLIGLGGRKQA